MRPDSRLAGKPLVTLRDCTEQPMIQPKTNFVHRGQMHPLFFNARLQNRGQLDVASCCAFRCSTSAAQCTASWNFTRGERPSCPSSRRLLPGSLRRPAGRCSSGSTAGERLNFLVQPLAGKVYRDGFLAERPPNRALAVLIDRSRGFATRTAKLGPEPRGARVDSGPVRSYPFCAGKGF